VQIKIHFVSWLKSSSKVCSITSKKNYCLTNTLSAIGAVISLGFILATLLINSKDTVFRKAISPFPVQHEPLPSYIQFQFSEILFIHITFSKFTTSTELCYWPMIASIHLYLEKDINLFQAKSRVERTVKVSLPKQNSLLETKPHLLS